jgi:hypothetical protein
MIDASDGLPMSEGHGGGQISMIQRDGVGRIGSAARQVAAGTP